MSNASLVILSNEEVVGPKALANSLKILTLSLRYKQFKLLIQPLIQQILFQISLPLFMISQNEIQQFQNDPIEYLRMQSDNRSQYNVKKQLSYLVEKLCQIKLAKTQPDLLF